jgi:hypothetical protein
MCTGDGIRIRVAAFVALRVHLDEAIKVRKECELVFGWTPQTAPSPLHATAAAGQSVLSLIETRPAVNSIVTFCKELDDMLGGGIPLGEVTEICALTRMLGHILLAMQNVHRLVAQVEYQASGKRSSACN